MILLQWEKLGEGLVFSLPSASEKLELFLLLEDQACIGAVFHSSIPERDDCRLACWLLYMAGCLFEALKLGEGYVHSFEIKCAMQLAQYLDARGRQGMALG